MSAAKKPTREEILAQHPHWGQPDGRHFDRDGQPMSMLDWLERFEDVEHKRVARTDLPGGGFVSTVWLGLDHSVGRGPPLIFESMVWLDDGEKDCARYSTLDEAKAGHEAMVRKHGGGG